MIDCAVLGATGAVGQRFIRLLESHPTFRLAQVAASASRAGAALDDVPWHIEGEPVVTGLTLRAVEDVDSPVVFSALPGGIAGPAESALAAKGLAIFTNASDHRMDVDVPLLIPEVNPTTLELVRGKRGFIVANGNCSGIIVTLPLAPLVELGLDQAVVVTQQAISGAGAVTAADLGVEANVVPFIGGEEEKLESEPQKTLGKQFPITATCTRVPVQDGHFATVHVHLNAGTTVGDVARAMETFGNPDLVGLHFAPKQPIHVTWDPTRPQPALDRDAERGMAVTVGRIRDMGNGWFRFCVLGHNTIRGAAGQSILNAEFAARQGHL